MAGAGIAKQQYDGYIEAGRDAGDGVGAVTVTISRPGTPIGPEWNPTPGAPVIHTFLAMPAGMLYAQRSGLALGNKEKAYDLVNHNGATGGAMEITPSTSDTLTIDGVNWPVIDVRPIDDAGYPFSWLVKVSR